MHDLEPTSEMAVISLKPCSAAPGAKFGGINLNGIPGKKRWPPSDGGAATPPKYHKQLKMQG
jgi:hypothetical protein